MDTVQCSAVADRVPLPNLEVALYLLGTMVLVNVEKGHSTWLFKKKKSDGLYHTYCF